MELRLEDFADLQVAYNAAFKFVFLHDYPEIARFEYDFPMGRNSANIIYSDKQTFPDVLTFFKHMITLPYVNYDHYQLAGLERFLPFRIETFGDEKAGYYSDWFVEEFGGFLDCPFTSFSCEFTGEKSGIQAHFNSLGPCFVVEDEKGYCGFWWMAEG